jgi:hypothetical protein
MVAAIEAATVLTLMARRQFSRRDIGRAGLVVAAVVLVALVEGYGAMFKPGPASMRAGGFGHFSWNLATLLVPMPGMWGPGLVVRDATGGQYEGDGYIGGGVVLLALALLVARPAQIAAALREHWLLALTVLACMVFAASNRMFWGSHLLATMPLPERVLDIAALFRASGRFIWVAAYAITVFCVIAWMRWMPGSVALIGLVVASSVTAAEMRLMIPSVTASTSVHPADLVDRDQMRAWLSAHERLFQFPSNFCGGLVVDAQWGGKETNRELQVQLIAARLGRPSNSIYTSRPLKDCGVERRFASEPVLEAGTLYMITHAPERLTPGLARLVASTACLDAGYTYVCSRQPLEIESAQRDAPLTLQPSVVRTCPGAPAPAATASWRTGPSEAVDLRIGAPDGPIAGSGAVGNAEIAVPAGTLLYLMPKDSPSADALDVEAVYYATGDCVAKEGARP